MRLSFSAMSQSKKFCSGLSASAMQNRRIEYHLPASPVEFQPFSKMVLDVCSHSCESCRLKNIMVILCIHDQQQKNYPGHNNFLCWFVRMNQNHSAHLNQQLVLLLETTWTDEMKTRITRFFFFTASIFIFWIIADIQLDWKQRLWYYSQNSLMVHLVPSYKINDLMVKAMY